MEKQKEDSSSDMEKLKPSDSIIDFQLIKQQFREALNEQVHKIIFLIGSKNSKSLARHYLSGKALDQDNGEHIKGSEQQNQSFYGDQDSLIKYSIQKYQNANYVVIEGFQIGSSEVQNNFNQLSEALLRSFCRHAEQTKIKAEIVFLYALSSKTIFQANLLQDINKLVSILSPQNVRIQSYVQFFVLSSQNPKNEKKELAEALKKAVKQKKSNTTVLSNLNLQKTIFLSIQETRNHSSVFEKIKYQSFEQIKNVLIQEKQYFKTSSSLKIDQIKLFLRLSIAVFKVIACLSCYIDSTKKDKIQELFNKSVQSLKSRQKQGYSIKIITKNMNTVQFKVPLLPSEKPIKETLKILFQNSSQTIRLMRSKVDKKIINQIQGLLYLCQILFEFVKLQDQDIHQDLVLIRSIYEDKKPVPTTTRKVVFKGGTGPYQKFKKNVEKNTSNLNAIRQCLQMILKKEDWNQSIFYVKLLRDIFNLYHQESRDEPLLMEILELYQFTDNYYEFDILLTKALRNNQLNLEEAKAVFNNLYQQKQFKYCLKVVDYLLANVFDDDIFDSFIELKQAIIKQFYSLNLQPEKDKTPQEKQDQKPDKEVREVPGIKLSFYATTVENKMSKQFLEKDTFKIFIAEKEKGNDKK